ncbi:uncharacterized protein LOC135265979 [Tribolium castaneum]|uniref:uncharacterized protein LOC135265979 n=1 Tax=Tribolium castaneum TaxID=7070 RepID=UPI0030FEDECA
MVAHTSKQINLRALSPDTPSRGALSLLICVSDGAHRFLKMGSKKRKRSSSSSSSDSSEGSDLVVIRKQLKKALKDVKRLTGKKRLKENRRHYSTRNQQRGSDTSSNRSSSSEGERSTSLDSEKSVQGNEEDKTLKKLPPEIRKMLGSQSPPSEMMGKPIHEEVAQVWEQTLQKGLNTEEIKDLLQKYPPIANCKLVQAPKLNAEVKRAITQQHSERDERLAHVQAQLGAAMGAVGTALTFCLQEEGGTTSQLIELLGDAGKLLASVHFAESQSRRILASAGINKTFKSTLTETPVDGWLFGDNLSERMKTTRALEKTSEELKIPKAKINTGKTQYNLNSKSLPRQYSQSRGRHNQSRSKQQPKTGRGDQTRRNPYYRPRTSRIEPPRRKH